MAAAVVSRSRAKSRVQFQRLAPIFQLGELFRRALRRELRLSQTTQRRVLRLFLSRERLRRRRPLLLSGARVQRQTRAIREMLIPLQSLPLELAPNLIRRALARLRVDPRALQRRRRRRVFLRRSTRRRRPAPPPPTPPPRRARPTWPPAREGFHRRLERLVSFPGLLRGVLHRRERLGRGVRSASSARVSASTAAPPPSRPSREPVLLFARRRV